MDVRIIAVYMILLVGNIEAAGRKFFFPSNCSLVNESAVLKCE
jgi:hypothetical protein